jgi:hypothetical protein
LKRLMKYLNGTADLKLTYGGDHINNVLTAYVDADFAMDIDDRKSRSGFALMLNGGPISWGSKEAIQHNEQHHRGRILRRPQRIPRSCVAPPPPRQPWLLASRAHAYVQRQPGCDPINPKPRISPAHKAY